MLLSARISSFLAGAAIAGAFAFYQLRQDLLASQQVLLDQVQLHCVEHARSSRRCPKAPVRAWAEHFPLPNGLLAACCSHELLVFGGH